MCAGGLAVEVPTRKVALPRPRSYSKCVLYWKPSDAMATGGHRSDDDDDDDATRG